MKKQEAQKTMTVHEMHALVGKTLTIRRAKHLCLAAGSDSLLLLQLCARDEALFRTGDPVQYIVAQYPEWHQGELVWGQGHYYPICSYTEDGPSSTAAACALLDAALCLAGIPMNCTITEDDKSSLSI